MKIRSNSKVSEPMNFIMSRIIRSCRVELVRSVLHVRTITSNDMQIMTQRQNHRDRMHCSARVKWDNLTHNSKIVFGGMHAFALFTNGQPGQAFS